MVRVFKTSVSSVSEVEQLSAMLNTFIHPEGRWNFDLEDCDKILRIESPDLHVTGLIDGLKNEGYHCEELF